MVSKVFLIFTPNLWEMIPFDEIVCQRGWFNHQLECDRNSFTLFVPSISVGKSFIHGAFGYYIDLCGICKIKINIASNDVMNML